MFFSVTTELLGTSQICQCITRNLTQNFKIKKHVAKKNGSSMYYSCYTTFNLGMWYAIRVRVEG